MTEKAKMLFDDMQKMLEDLAKEDLVIATLHNSELKRSADAQMKRLCRRSTKRSRTQDRDPRNR